MPKTQQISNLSKSSETLPVLCLELWYSKRWLTFPSNSSQAGSALGCSCGSLGQRMLSLDDRNHLYNCPTSARIQNVLLPGSISRKCKKHESLWGQENYEHHSSIYKRRLLFHAVTSFCQRIINKLWPTLHNLWRACSSCWHLWSTWKRSFHCWCCIEI